MVKKTVRVEDQKNYLATKTEWTLASYRDIDDMDAPLNFYRLKSVKPVNKKFV